MRPAGKSTALTWRSRRWATARTLARSHGLDNLTCHVADVTNLPFPDDYFDLAHGHDILAHVPDTRAVLAEVMRTLKPGGIIGCREFICEACYTYPDFGILRKSWDIFEDVIATDGGHPQMGKELKTHLAAAGFADIRTSGSFHTYSAPEDIAFIHEFVHRWVLSPEITETALSYGAGTEELFRLLGEGYDRWQDHPGAVCAVAFGEAIAVKP